MEGVQAGNQAQRRRAGRLLVHAWGDREDEGPLPPVRPDPSPRAHAPTCSVLGWVGLGDRRKTRPDGQGLCGMLQTNFGEHPFYEVG